MEVTFHCWAAFVFLLIFTTLRSKLASCQPVIAEEFLFAEQCSRSSTSAEQLRKHIDIITEELQRQNQENMLLKEEVEELKAKHNEQKILLGQLMDSVGNLVQKIKNGQQSCACHTQTTDSKKYGVLSGNITLLEPPNPDVTSTTSPSSSENNDTPNVTTGSTDTREPVTTDVPSTPPTPPDRVKDVPPSITSSEDILVSDVPSSVSSVVTTTDQTQISQTLETGVLSPLSTPQGVTDTTATVESSLTSSHPDKPTTTRQSSGYLAVYPRDCQDLRSSRPIFSGQYTIFPINASKPFRVYCEVDDDVAWTVVQRREGGEVDFYRNWSDYREGFGRLTGEFWLGNEHLHELTRQASYKLRIDMWDWAGTFYHAESRYIHVDPESDYYALHAPDDYYAYSGFVASGLRVHRGPFMTYDRQDPSMISENCAQRFHSGWWFTTCVRNANLNGKYYEGGYDKNKKSRNIDDIYWHSISQSLKKVVMKLYRTKDTPFRTSS